ncbi:hypothetical protein KP509_11G001500 [Ceratopteris richardii]|uniref:Reverse transcriptase zinc-binding domain-containing protein n=1 Tax=Ceratopteris richardii TaxID=49495 RepID=A0A8T2TNI0_CERRI|nr:hypothetical protein KP509_11G001500 [Ceratopteris richardii]
MWLILHHGVWCGSKARKFGIKDEVCMFCGNEEDIPHLFFSCVHAQKFWSLLQPYCQQWNINLAFKETLIGSSNKFDYALSNIWRGHILWFIWRSRNDRLFKNCRSSLLHSCFNGLKALGQKSITAVRDVPPGNFSLSEHLAITSPCKWRETLLQMYSKNRFEMVFLCT